MLFFNFLCLFYLMVLTRCHTISKSIATYEDLSDRIDSLNDYQLDRVFSPRHERIHPKYRREEAGKTTELTIKSKEKITPLKTTRYAKHGEADAFRPTTLTADTSQVPELANATLKPTMNLFRRIQHKFARKNKTKTLKLTTTKKRRHKKLKEIKKDETANFIGRDKRYLATKLPSEPWDHNASFFRHFKTTTHKIKNIFFDGDTLSTNTNMFNTDRINNVYNSYENPLVDTKSKGSNEESYPPPYTSPTEKSTIPQYLDDLDTFSGTASIESLLNKIKLHAMNIITEQSPMVSEIITNTVTETTFDADPILHSLSTTKSLGETIVVGDEDAELIETVENDKKSQAQHVFQDIKSKTTTMATNIEHKLQREIKDALKKAKNTLADGINKACDQVKSVTWKIMHNSVNVNGLANVRNGMETTKEMVQETTTPSPEITQDTTRTSTLAQTQLTTKSTTTQQTKLSTLSTSTTRATKATTRLNRATSTGNYLVNLETTTEDDYSMLKIFEDSLAKNHEDNVLKMLTVATPANRLIPLKNVVKVSKRDTETVENLNLKENIRKQNDGEGMPDEDYNVDREKNTKSNQLNVEIYNNNDDESPTKLTESTIRELSTPDNSYAALSNKIHFTEFINGYKHYLNFARDLSKFDSNFSNRVCYQAHRHHNVDDIGKFILTRLPPIPEWKSFDTQRRDKRHFFDNSDIENNEVTTKTEESWFRRHFYIFHDKPPKKYHTEQTVTLKTKDAVQKKMEQDKNISYKTDTTLGESEGLEMIWKTTTPHQSPHYTYTQRTDTTSFSWNEPVQTSNPLKETKEVITEEAQSTTEEEDLSKENAATMQDKLTKIDESLNNLINKISKATASVRDMQHSTSSSTYSTNPPEATETHSEAKETDAYLNELVSALVLKNYTADGFKKKHSNSVMESPFNVINKLFSKSGHGNDGSGTNGDNIDPNEAVNIENAILQEISRIKRDQKDSDPQAKKKYFGKYTTPYSVRFNQAALYPSSDDKCKLGFVDLNLVAKPQTTAQPKIKKGKYNKMLTKLKLKKKKKNNKNKDKKLEGGKQRKERHSPLKMLKNLFKISQPYPDYSLYAKTDPDVFKFLKSINIERNLKEFMKQVPNISNPEVLFKAADFNKAPTTNFYFIPDDINMIMNPMLTVTSEPFTYRTVPKSEVPQLKKEKSTMLYNNANKFSRISLRISPVEDHTTNAPKHSPTRFHVTLTPMSLEDLMKDYIKYKTDSISSTAKMFTTQDLVLDNPVLITANPLLITTTRPTLDAPKIQFKPRFPSTRDVPAVIKDTTAMTKDFNAVAKDITALTKYYTAVTKDYPAVTKDITSSTKDFTAKTKDINLYDSDFKKFGIQFNGLKNLLNMEEYSKFGIKNYLRDETKENTESYGIKTILLKKDGTQDIKNLLDTDNSENQKANKDNTDEIQNILYKNKEEKDIKDFIRLHSLQNMLHKKIHTDDNRFKSVLHFRDNGKYSGIRGGNNHNKHVENEMFKSVESSDNNQINSEVVSTDNDVLTETNKLYSFTKPTEQISSTKPYKKYPDYFSDFFNWNQDILTMDHVTNPSMEEMVNVTTTVNLNKLKEDIRHMKDYLKYLTTRRPQNRQATSNNTRKVSLTPKKKHRVTPLLKRSNESDKFRRGGAEKAKFQSLDNLNQVINDINKLYSNSFKKPNVPGVVDFHEFMLTPMPILDTESTTSTESLSMDATVLAYDDGAATITQKLRPSPKSIRDESGSKTATALKTKVSPLPKQYFMTPVPMQPTEFDQFLKENGFDIQNITSPYTEVSDFEEKWEKSGNHVESKLMNVRGKNEKFFDYPKKFADLGRIDLTPKRSHKPSKTSANNRIVYNQERYKVTKTENVFSSGRDQYAYLHGIDNTDYEETNSYSRPLKNYGKTFDSKSKRKVKTSTRTTTDESVTTTPGSLHFDITIIDMEDIMKMASAPFTDEGTTQVSKITYRTSPATKRPEHNHKESDDDTLDFSPVIERYPDHKVPQDINKIEQVNVPKNEGTEDTYTHPGNSYKFEENLFKTPKTKLRPYLNKGSSKFKQSGIKQIDKTDLFINPEPVLKLNKSKSHKGKKNKAKTKSDKANKNLHNELLYRNLITDKYTNAAKTTLASSNKYKQYQKAGYKLIKTPATASTREHKNKADNNSIMKNVEDINDPKSTMKLTVKPSGFTYETATHSTKVLDDENMPDAKATTKMLNANLKAKFQKKKFERPKGVLFSSNTLKYAVYFDDTERKMEHTYQKVPKLQQTTQPTAKNKYDQMSKLTSTATTKTEVPGDKDIDLIMREVLGDTGKVGRRRRKAMWRKWKTTPLHNPSCDSKETKNDQLTSKTDSRTTSKWFWFLSKKSQSNDSSTTTPSTTIAMSGTSVLVINTNSITSSPFITESSGAFPFADEAKKREQRGGDSLIYVVDVLEGSNYSKRVPSATLADDDIVHALPPGNVSFIFPARIANEGGKAELNKGDEIFVEKPWSKTLQHNLPRFKPEETPMREETHTHLEKVKHNKAQIKASPSAPAQVQGLSPAQSPAVQSPAAKSPAAQSPAAKSPAAQAPAAQLQAAQSPAGQLRAAQTPAAQSQTTQSTQAKSKELAQTKVKSKTQVQETSSNEQEACANVQSSKCKEPRQKKYFLGLNEPNYENYFNVVKDFSPSSFIRKFGERQPDKRLVSQEPGYDFQWTAQISPQYHIATIIKYPDTPKTPNIFPTSAFDLSDLSNAFEFEAYTPKEFVEDKSPNPYTTEIVKNIFSSFEPSELENTNLFPITTTEQSFNISNIESRFPVVITLDSKELETIEPAKHFSPNIHTITHTKLHKSTPYCTISSLKLPPMKFTLDFGTTMNSTEMGRELADIEEKDKDNDKISHQEQLKKLLDQEQSRQYIHNSTAINRELADLDKSDREQHIDNSTEMSRELADLEEKGRENQKLSHQEHLKKVSHQEHLKKVSHQEEVQQQHIQKEIEAALDKIEAAEAKSLTSKNSKITGDAKLKSTPKHKSNKEHQITIAKIKTTKKKVTKAKVAPAPKVQDAELKNAIQAKKAALAGKEAELKKALEKITKQKFQTKTTKVNSELPTRKSTATITKTTSKITSTTSALTKPETLTPKLTDSIKLPTSTVTNVKETSTTSTMITTNATELPITKTVGSTESKNVKSQKSHIFKRQTTESLNTVYTAKDVAALEVIVDLMKEPGESASAMQTGGKSIHGGSSEYHPSTSAIQVHIGVPYLMQDKKRAALEPSKLRKVFSAKMSVPVDIEYQVRSLDNPDKVINAYTGYPNKQESCISPGMYLLVEDNKQNRGFALKPVSRQIKQDLVTSTSKNTNPKILSRVPLSKDYIQSINKQLMELYQNLSCIDNTTKHTIKRRFDENSRTRYRRKISWGKVLEYVGHDDRVCDCKCLPNQPMCKTCAASDAVMTELMFEFENLSKYMCDHCTEIQTFFWMNPTAGRKLRDIVQKIDKSINDYYKRVKGKCQGRPCSCVEKREFTETVVENYDTYIQKSLIREFEDLASSLEQVQKLKLNCNEKFKTILDRFVKISQSCTKGYKEKRSPPAQKVYSLDNINVNIICSDNSLYHEISTIPYSTNDISTSDVSIFDYTDDEVQKKKTTNRFKQMFVKRKGKRAKTKPAKRDALVQIESPIVVSDTSNLWKEYLKDAKETTIAPSKPTANIEPVISVGILEKTNKNTVTLNPRLKATLVKVGDANLNNTNDVKNEIFLRKFPQRDARNENKINIDELTTKSESLSNDMKQLMKLFESLPGGQEVGFTAGFLNRHKPTEKTTKKDIEISMTVQTMKGTSPVLFKKSPKINLPHLSVTTVTSSSLPERNYFTFKDIGTTSEANKISLTQSLPPQSNTTRTKESWFKKLKNKVIMITPVFENDKHAREAYKTNTLTTKKGYTELKAVAMNANIDVNSDITTTSFPTLFIIEDLANHVATKNVDQRDSLIRNIMKYEKDTIDSKLTKLNKRHNFKLEDEMNDILLMQQDKKGDNSKATTEVEFADGDYCLCNKLRKIKTQLREPMTVSTSAKTTTTVSTTTKAMTTTTKKVSKKKSLLQLFMDLKNKHKAGQRVVEEKQQPHKKDQPTFASTQLVEKQDEQQRIKEDMDWFLAQFASTILYKSTSSLSYLDKMTDTTPLNDDFDVGTTEPDSITDVSLKNLDSIYSHGSVYDYSTTTSTTSRAKDITIPIQSKTAVTNSTKEKNSLSSTTPISTSTKTSTVKVVTTSDTTKSSLSSPIVSSDPSLSKTATKSSDSVNTTKPVNTKTTKSDTITKISTLKDTIDKIEKAVDATTNSTDAIKPKQTTPTALTTEKHTETLGSKKDEKLTTKLDNAKTKGMKIKSIDEIHETRPHGESTSETTLKKLLNKELGKKVSLKEACDRETEACLCDIHATSDHIVDVRRTMRRNDFERYVRNLTCYRYVRPPPFFLLEPWKRKIQKHDHQKQKRFNKYFESAPLQKSLRWDWIRKKRELLSINDYERDTETMTSTDGFVKQNENHYRLGDNSVDSDENMNYEAKIDTDVNAHQMEVNNDFEENSDDDFEKLYKGEDNVYRTFKKRRKRTTGDMEELMHELKDLPPLKSRENELFAMLGDKMSLDCLHRSRSHKSAAPVLWDTERTNMLTPPEVVLDGSMVILNKVQARHTGNYTCSQDGKSRTVKLTVVTLPQFFVVFIPMYSSKHGCSYDDLRAIQRLGPLMTKKNYACARNSSSIKIDEPICLEDKEDGSLHLRATAILAACRYPDVKCSAQCRRDLQCAFALLCAANSPVLYNVKVVLARQGYNKTLVPSFRNSRRLIVTHTLRKKELQKHPEYHQLAASMYPGNLDIVVSCPAGFYLLPKQKICVACPADTYAGVGENTCYACAAGTSSEPGSARCKLSLRKMRRYDWWWYPPCGYALAGVGVLCACVACTACALAAHVTSRSTARAHAAAVSVARADSHATRSLRYATKRFSSTSGATRGGPPSPSAVILARFYRASLSSSRATDSQETKFEIWKEKNIPPPLPPIDFDLG